MWYNELYQVLTFIPIPGKLYQSIVTYMFNFGDNCNTVENNTIGTIYIFIYKLGYTCSFLLNNNDTIHKIQKHKLVFFYKQIHLLNIGFNKIVLITKTRNNITIPITVTYIV